MTTPSTTQETSKFLSYILRHAPESIGLSLDSDGWADISSLITLSSNHGHTLDRAALDRVVATSDKKRFAISEDGTRIRAVQGHSTPSVRREYPEKKPPPVLYHGTAIRFLESIQRQGLNAGARHHVHLSKDVSTALTVGRRHGKPVILEIQAEHMSQQGYKFYVAENDVWLTSEVPVEFISVLNAK
uniref:RNA 2'-phosphotransferase n=1 Tax=Bordetella sputigena TaxID=1416810 RepID=UPI0039EEB0F7